MTYDTQHPHDQYYFSYGKGAEAVKEYLDTNSDEVINAIESTILSGRDKSNANSDTRLLSTWKLSIADSILSKLTEEVLLHDLPKEVKDAVRDGYLYIHDKASRLLSFNCCLLNVKKILANGYIHNNMRTMSPHRVSSALSVITDIIQIQSGSQYGGLTLPDIDDALAPYVKKTYNEHYTNFTTMGHMSPEDAEALAYEYTRQDLRQGIQGMIYAVNSVTSSRGDYPFITVSFGLNTSKWGKLVSMEFLHNRLGTGRKTDYHIPAVFPKLIFLYDEELHGEGKKNNDLFKQAVRCSAETQYPDFLSLEKGAVGDMYHKYGKAVSAMGCRAFLSPYFRQKEGSSNPDETELSIYRFNLGVISLNIPMIIKRALVEGKDWKEVLSQYQQYARMINKEIYEISKDLSCSTSPLATRYGGFDGVAERYRFGEDLIKGSTISFGYGGLNEASILLTGNPISEDKGSTAREILKVLNNNVEQYKKEDDILYALYGTPGESWLTAAVDAYKAKYGDDDITSNGYWTNSFHVDVKTDITPTQKMKCEAESFHMSNGGHIVYSKIPTTTNLSACEALVKEAMAEGLYYGLNHNADYCTDCGEAFISDEDTKDPICPVCGSSHIESIRRMNGYLGFTSDANGETRFSDAKTREIRSRKCM